MKKQTRHDVAFWKRQLEQWRTSGLTQEAYCRQQDLSFTTFARYRNRINRERKAQTGAGVSFVPVAIKAESRAPIATPNERQHSAAKPIEIRLGNGRSVLTSGGFDDAELKRVIRLLEMLPC
jgi:hypothetical protein